MSDSFARFCQGCDYRYPSTHEAAASYVCPRCGSTASRVEATLVAEVAVAGEVASVEIISAVWLSWLEIALDQEELARRARVAAAATADSSVMSAEMTKEFRASLIGIAAAAHSIDALYGSMAVPKSIRFKVSQAMSKRPTRRNQILEALKLTFAVGKGQHRWVKDFKWLFGLRDAAAHAQEKPETPQDHPLGTRTSPGQVTYSVENLIHAVDIALDVAKTCFDNPKPNVPEAVKWARHMRPSVALLEQRRDSVRQMLLPSGGP